MDVRTFLEFGRQMLNEHGLADWKLELDRAKKRLGLCNHTDKTISLSVHHVDISTQDEILDTLLHEIAHALVGPKNNHNHIWRQKAIAIGCTGERCGESLKLQGSYKAVCTGCNREYVYHRKPKYMNRGKYFCICKAEVKWV